jgi:hypothetical protein
MQRPEAEIVEHDRQRKFGSRSRQKEDMRSDAAMMLVRVFAGAAFMADRVIGAGRSRMLVVALVCILIVVVVFNRTDGIGRGMIVIA